MNAFSKLFSIFDFRRTSLMFATSLLLCLLLKQVAAQPTFFQHTYGTALNNSFTKTLRSGTGYYVLGRDEPSAGAPNRATVTRLDAQGQHQWTLRLDVASQWNDAVVTPNGNLLVVGNTLPFDANSRSLAAVATPAGAFSWVRSYNVPGRESFSRVVRNPSPNNGAFPYYILGTQWDPGGNATWDDVVLLTLSEAGNFGWKKRYTSLFDDEFARDLEALPNGDLLLAGNLGTNGVVFRADNTGAFFSAAGPGGLSFSFADVAQTSGGFLAVGSTFPSVSAYLMKFDHDLLVQWQISLPDLTAVSQVWRDGDDGIYVTGRATANGINRGVVLKFQDFGNDPAPLIWMKYLDNAEVAYTGGSSWYLPPSQLAFCDGRNTSERAFLSVSDLDMNTCMTAEGFVSTVSADLLFNSPVPPNIEFVDMPVGTDVTLSSAVNWEQAEACPDPMDASISGVKYRACDGLPYTNQPPLSGWTIQLLDGMGNVLDEQVTDTAGRYAFYDLPLGVYYCREVQQPGWTPKVPVSGEVAVTLNASQQRVVNFGNCPSCSCDDVYFDLAQVPGTSDTCEYILTATNESPYCFNEINIALSAGVFESIEPAAGWEVVLIDSQHVKLVLLCCDWTTFVFHRMRIMGASMAEVTVSTSYNIGQGDVVCSRAFGVVCPPPVSPAPCCPPGSTFGPELVINGDFDGSGGFTSGYTNNCTNQSEGQYCITSDASTVNAGFVACTDTIGTGNIFVANGSAAANTDVLCYSFNVAPNRDYIFSFIHTSVTGASPAQFGVYVNGTLTGIIAQASPVPCDWRQHCVRWNSGNITSVNICIRNLNPAAQGNDFAIDKVRFRECRKCAPWPANAAVLWMPMDETGGENTIQSIVGGLAAIPNTPIGLGGPSPANGVVDFQGFSLGALCFTGPTPASHATVSNDPSLNFGAGSFTIDTWIKTSLNTQSAPIVNKLDGNGNGYAFYIAGNPSGPSYLMLDIGTGASNLQFQGPQIALGQWNFVAVVVAPPSVTFYIGDAPGPGAAFSSVSLPINGTTNASSSSPLLIGKNAQNPHWTICMDELEIFKTALSAAEIQSIWAADDEGKCRSLCTCGGFSKIAVRNKNGTLNKLLDCGNQPEPLPCVPGQGYHLTGVFHCDGGECEPEHEIRWTLSGPGGTQSGSFTDNDPFFGIHLLPNWFGSPGVYTLTLNGDCGTEACTCVVKFDVNCPNLCPCDASDIQALERNTAKGFATAVSLKNCKACFSPLALSDCESVDWWLNAVGGTYLGSTTGKQTLCYTFPQAGTYTVVMDVTRTIPGGSLCASYTYTRTVWLSCLDVVTDCPSSVLSNAEFNVNPVPGDLGDIGVAPGWTKKENAGPPYEVHLLEYGNSQDGWVMGITGSYTGAGVLSTEAPLCVSKSDTGTLTMTLRTPGDPIPGAMIKVGRKPPGGGNNIILYTGNTMPWPNCQDASCYSLAVLEDLLPFDDDDWYELRIPYNLSDWQALDSCGDFSGSIPARMAVYVGNYLSEEQQSAGPIREGVVIDNICFQGMTVSTKEQALSGTLRLFPNPTTGHFILELPAPGAPGTTIRITDPTGRLALEATAEVGSEQQQVRAGALPAGMYFVQVLQSGRVVGVSRFVKQ